MVGIVRSKKQLITAVKSSGSSPATFTPIQFTRPVSHAAFGTSLLYGTGYVFFYSYYSMSTVFASTKYLLKLVSVKCWLQADQIM
jgi:hypothetical protein